MSEEKKDLAEKAPFLVADAVKSEAGEKKEKEYLEAEENDEEDTTCGFSIFKGPRMQRCASETMYVAIYGIAGCYMAMAFTYFSGTITTLEKRYRIPTRTSGIISVGNDISAMFASVIVGYYLRKVHRPRWMGLGLYTIFVFCLMNCSLHFIYGAGEDALKLTREFGNLQNLTSMEGQQLCLDEVSSCEKSVSQWAPQVILFVAQLILGLGSAVFWVVGVAYMDDNSTKSKTPAMLTYSNFLRMLGPSIGYSLSSVCLRWYIEPQLTPLIKPEDSRWLGAWWLGWIILAILAILIGFLISLFPKEMPSTRARRLKQQKSESKDEKDPMDLSASDMWRLVKSLATNKVYVYNTFASILYFFGYMVYWIYTPKYIETQYRLSASKATMATGSAAFGFSAVGIILSGYIVTKYKPRARSMAAWNAIVDFLTVAGILCYVAIGCESSDQLGAMAVKSDCSASCHCDYVHYAPVCASNNVTFISACHAGCTANDPLGNKYTGCGCVNGFNESTITNLTDVSQLQYVVDGACPVDCSKQFLIFLAVMCFLKLVGASSKSTNFLISLRCMPSDEKSFGLGMGCFVASLLAFIPSPIFFGWLIDKYCLVWGKTCTDKGNCWLYDTHSLRYVLNLTAAFFVCMGGLFNIFVWYYSKDLQLFDDEHEGSKEKKMSLDNISIKDFGSSLQIHAKE